MATTTVQIARAPEDVFAFMTDPANLPAWQDAETVEQLTPGRVGPGTRFREVHKQMGRRRVELTEVVAYEPGRLFHIRVVEGPPVDGRWILEPTLGGTRLTLTPLAHLGGRAAALNRLVERITALAFRRHHRRLKAVLESD